MSAATAVAPVVLLGHVDHGKSTVFRALAPKDARCRENDRGNTIDFSVANIGGVTLIDVPGHRDYRANTFAAIAGAGAFALVVAADEGVAPQTLDHLEFALASGLRRGVLLWTKADRVTAAAFDAIGETVRTRLLSLGAPPLAERVLGDARAPSENTLARLREALVQAASPLPRSSSMRERGSLWVDRTFISRTGGRVVTGTWRGDEPVLVGDELWSGRGTAWRVRSLESHGQRVLSADEGTRVALSVAGDGSPNRGDRWVKGSPLESVRRVDVVMEGQRHRFRSGVSCEVWNGTCRALATMDGFRDRQARFRFAKSFPLAVGDRLVLRDGGGESTLGYAIVIEPSPTTPFRKAAEGYSATNAYEAFLDRRTVVSSALWRAHTLRAVAPERSVSERRWEEALQQAENTILASEKPLAGRTLRRLPTVQRLGALFEEWTGALRNRAGIHTASGWWWSNSIEASDASPWRQRTHSLLARIAAGTWNSEEATRSERESIEWLVATGSLVAMGERELWPTARYEAFLRKVEIAFAGATQGRSVGELKESLALSRREAVRLLEMLDRHGVTRREGDKRVLISSGRVPSLG